MEFVDSRWRQFRGEPPRRGEVFVARNENILHHELFLVRKRAERPCTEVVYLHDQSTVLASPGNFFTHWLPVAESQGGK